MPHFPLAEYEARRLKASEELRNRSLAGAVLTMPDHLNYLTGIDPTDIHDEHYGILADDGGIVLIVPIDDADLARDTMAQGLDLETYGFAESPGPRVASLLKARGLVGGRLGYEGNWWTLRRSRFLELTQLVGGAEWIDCTDILREQRNIKSPAEIAIVRKSAKLSDIAMTAGVSVMHEGVREFEVEAAIQETFASFGSEYASFPPLVCSGWRSGLFHGFPTDRRLEHGDAVFIELAGVVARYHTNLCRTIFVGEVTPRHAKLWDVVRRAFWTPIERGLIRPGLPVGPVDSLTKEIRAEYAGYFPARSGFGVELSYPPVWSSSGSEGSLSILEGDPHVFTPGMVFALEPSVAAYDGTTVILGSDILITEEGHELLSTFSHDLIVC